MARLVAAWEAASGGLPRPAARPALVMVEPFAGKVAELVDRSRAQVRRTGYWWRGGAGATAVDAQSGGSLCSIQPAPATDAS